MRLLDRLFTDKFDAGIATESEIRELLEQAQMVAADNVAAYWLSTPGDEVPVASDFPNVMLPFEYTFVEMKWPNTTKDTKLDLESTGILFTMTEPKELQVTRRTGVALVTPDVKWHLRGLLFFQQRGKIPRLMSQFLIPVGQDGAPVPDHTSGGKLGFAVSFYPRESHDLPEELMGRFHTSLITAVGMPALLALSFMHCRNVKVLTEQPPPKLSKKHQKRTGRPLVKYRVLQIDHMKQVLEREGKASSEGLKKALHICRGHFKHYGRDGKGLLFGKHVATVWIPMHTRGNIEEGAVVKDYEVK